MNSSKFRWAKRNFTPLNALPPGVSSSGVSLCFIDGVALVTALRELGVGLSASGSDYATPWRHRTPLIVGTALSAVGASVLYALAAGEHAEFVSSPTMTQSEADALGYQTDLKGLQSRANVYSYVAYGAAGLGLVLGIGTVITW